MADLKQPIHYPDTLALFHALCAEQGQTKPTPLLLRYESGGYNTLHQDLYGTVFFPFQVVKPHWHCADARVFVVKGTLLIGFQANFDKTKVIELNAGDYFLAPFRYPHYEGSRGETLIVGTGVGPWCTVGLPQKP